MGMDVNDFLMMIVINISNAFAFHSEKVFMICTTATFKHLSFFAVSFSKSLKTRRHFFIISRIKGPSKTTEAVCGSVYNN